MTYVLEINGEDRVALMREAIVVLSVESNRRGTQVYVTAPDDDQARDAVRARFGSDVDVVMCGDVPREIRPRPCVGYMEREAGRLQLRYVMQGEQHLDDIVVAEDERTVVVLGMVCDLVTGGRGEFIESPYHVYLQQPLGDRVVIDAFTREPVPFKNVYEEIQRRQAMGEAVE